MSSQHLSIALVGTRGVPARYGGFETCVEEVGRRLVERGHHVRVYCRDGNEDLGNRQYLGMELVHLPALQRRSLETLSHTGVSTAHLLFKRTDAAIVFNAANAPWLPVLRAARIPVATHVDGLEWKRAKWGPAGKKYYRWAESAAVRFSDALIADAVGIQDYYWTEFKADSRLISYGAPIVPADESHRISELGLNPYQYHLVVARFEPENHVDLIVEGYAASGAKLPLVIVGSAPYAQAYTNRIHALADDRVQFAGGVWDQQLLDQLYANSVVYWHGHSVGGTNPSLLRAIGAGAPVNAFDVNFNREVLGTSGQYFKTANDVSELVSTAEDDTSQCRIRGEQSRSIAVRYDWDTVAGRYEELCHDLATRAAGRTGGRRRRPPAEVAATKVLS